MFFSQPPRRGGGGIAVPSLHSAGPMLSLVGRRRRTTRWSTDQPPSTGPANSLSYVSIVCRISSFSAYPAPTPTRITRAVTSSELSLHDLAAFARIHADFKNETDRDHCGGHFQTPRLGDTHEITTLNTPPCMRQMRRLYVLCAAGVIFIVLQRYLVLQSCNISDRCSGERRLKLRPCFHDRHTDGAARRSSCTQALTDAESRMALRPASSRACRADS